VRRAVRTEDAVQKAARKEVETTRTQNVKRNSKFVVERAMLEQYFTGKRGTVKYETPCKCSRPEVETPCRRHGEGKSKHVVQTEVLKCPSLLTTCRKRGERKT
jgi:hypothetical protein